ncbi:MAG: hypothetical protein Q7K34_00705 [archaeon]|nr:hypothetical protein [archaeon]
MPKRIIKLIRRAAGKAFSKKPPEPEVKKNRPPGAQRFLLMELSHQSNYIPALTKIHNRMIRAPVFHEGTGILAVTGKREIDSRIHNNSVRMYEMHGQMSRLGYEAVALGKKRRYQEMDKRIDTIRGIEAGFNDAKQENLKLLMHHFFEKEQGNARIGKRPPRKTRGPARAKIPGHLRPVDAAKSVLNELKIHATYIRRIAGILQRIEKEKTVHTDGKTFVITGDLEIDREVQQRAVFMEKIRQRVNLLRGKLAPQATSLEQIDHYIDIARELERQFSDLKGRNFKILLHFFHGSKP